MVDIGLFLPQGITILKYSGDDGINATFLRQIPSLLTTQHFFV